MSKSDVTFLLFFVNIIHWYYLFLSFSHVTYRSVMLDKKRKDREKEREKKRKKLPSLKNNKTRQTISFFGAFLWGVADICDSGPRAKVRGCIVASRLKGWRGIFLLQNVRYAKMVQRD